MSKTPVTMAESIDWLFSRMAAIYGPEWKRQCGDTPIGDIKTEWGYALAWCAGRPDAIRHALDNLPERCPNVIAFRNLCRSAPKAAPLLLAEPKSDPVFVAQVLAKLSDAPAKTDGREWARRIVARKAAGEYILPCTLGMAMSALGLTKQAVAA